MRIRLAAIVALLVVAGLFAASCGVPRSGHFSAIDEDNVPAVLTETTTTIPATTTTLKADVTTSTIVPPTTALTTEQVTMYYVSGEQLSPYYDYFAPPADAGPVLEALRRGPVGPASAGLRTAIPSGSTLQTSKYRGVLTVELGQAFFDGMTVASDERLAIAQIVLTLTQLRNVGAVAFTLNGEPISVQTTGAPSEPGQAMAAEDYEQLLFTSPPPPTSTTVAPPPAETSTTVGP